MAGEQVEEQAINIAELQSPPPLPLRSPGLMQDMPQAPSHRHFFLLLLQSSSEEHFRRHFWFSKLACSSSRGQSELGEFRGFLYTRPSSSASEESSSDDASQSSSSSSSAASGVAAVGTDRAAIKGEIQCQSERRFIVSISSNLAHLLIYLYNFPGNALHNWWIPGSSKAREKIAVPFSKMAATTISTRNHFFMLPAGDFHCCLCPE